MATENRNRNFNMVGGAGVESDSGRDEGPAEPLLLQSDAEGATQCHVGGERRCP